MFKIIVSTRTGEWEFIENVRVLDVEWWDEFESLQNNINGETLVKIANAFGKPLK